jgi:hypothetical protein
LSILADDRRMLVGRSPYWQGHGAEGGVQKAGSGGLSRDGADACEQVRLSGFVSDGERLIRSLTNQGEVNLLP